MKTTKPNWNMKKLGRMETSNTLRFDYPIQRAGGQWDELQQSLLIHSIAGDFPIPPILVLKGELDGEEVDYVIDGKQRTTNVLNYLAGVKDKEGNYPKRAYKLHKLTPDVEIEGVDEPIEIAGLYFDQLHEDVQAEILTSNFQVQRLEGASDEEVEELFNRWNNGTPLSKPQKARGAMGVQKAIQFAELVDSEFMTEKASITAYQTKRGENETALLQGLMLMSDYELSSTGFVANNVLQFAKEMRDMDITGMINDMKTVLNYMNEAIPAKNAILKRLHLPTMFLVAKKAHDEGVDKEVFNAWVEDFKTAFARKTKDKALVKTSYINFTGESSVKEAKVTGRKLAMMAHFDEFVKVYEPTPVEPVEEQEEVVEEPKAEVKEVEAPKAKKEEKAKKPTKKEIEEEMKDVAKEADAVFAGFEEAVTNK